MAVRLSDIPDTSVRLSDVSVGTRLSDIPETAQIAPDFGKRIDGTQKGLGFFGPLQRPDGDISTELSIGVGFDDRETEIPLLVPTLNQQEIDFLLSGGEATQEITGKAVSNARQRIGQGLSPFAQEGEQQTLPREQFDFSVEPTEAVPDPQDVSPPVVEPDRPLQFEAAPKRGFFESRRPPLPPNADRLEKIDRVFDIVVGTPLRVGLKFAKGLTLNVPDLAWAAIKKITPDDIWESDVKKMTLDQAMDWAAGHDPSGFEKLVGNVAEFAGRLRTSRGLGLKTGLLAKDLPKGITVFEKAFEAAKLFGFGETIRQFQRFLSEQIDPETDYQYEGATAVVKDMGLGAGLSLGNSLIAKPILSKAAQSQVGKAIIETYDRVMIEVSKRFPVLVDTLRRNPSEQMTKLVDEQLRARGIDPAQFTQEQRAVANIMAREFEKRFVKAFKNFKPPKDIVKARVKPKLIPGEVKQPAAITQPAKPPVKAVVPVAEVVKPKMGIKVPPKAEKGLEIAKEAPVKQIEVSDTEAAALLGESLEKIKANAELKQRLSKELIITEFQPSDFVPKARKGPGLTKAEQQIVTPKVQGELRFAQTQGLPVGFRAGQKEANDIAKRRLDDFRTARKVEKGALQDARKLVTEYAKDPVVAKKLITSLAKVDSPAKMAAFADKIGEFVKQAETKQKMTEYKTLFKQLKKDNKLGKEDFGKLRPAAIKRILEFDETIDLQKLSVAKKEDLEVLMGKVKDLGVDLSEGVRQLDVDTRDALNQLDPLIDSLDRLQKTAIADMAGDEIQVAIDTLRYIVRQNEIENKQIFGKRLVESRETETKAIAEVSVSKKQKKIFKREAKKGVVAKAKRPGVFAVLKRGTVGQSRTIPTLIQVSTVKGATATKKVLDDEIWDSFREANRTQFESVDFLREQYTKHNITVKTLDSFDKEVKVVIGGKSRVVTADDLGSMERHLRSLDKLVQLHNTDGIWIQGKLVTT